MFLMSLLKVLMDSQADRLVTHKHCTHLLHPFLQPQDKTPLAVSSFQTVRSPRGLRIVFVLLWKQQQGHETSLRSRNSELSAELCLGPQDPHRGPTLSRPSATGLGAPPATRTAVTCYGTAEESVSCANNCRDL